MFSLAPLIPLLVLCYAIPRVTCSNVFKPRQQSDDDDYNFFGGGGTIVGGRPVTQGKFTYPWFAKPCISRGEDIQWVGCGGSLVSPEWVLTAAHCINDEFKLNDPGYLIGAKCLGPERLTNLKCEQPSEQLSVDKIVIHPEFDVQLRTNDIALVRLDKLSSVTPAAIDDRSPSQLGYNTVTKLWAVGFGHTTYPPHMLYNKYPTKLQHARITYLNNDRCNQYHTIKITDDMICANAPGKSSCNGDSGGPLYDRVNELIAGVVSFGSVDCGEKGQAGVYSRVSANYEWIRDTICAGHRSPRPEFCENDKPSVSRSTCENDIEISSIGTFPYKLYGNLASCTSKDEHLFRINYLTDSNDANFSYQLKPQGQWDPDITWNAFGKYNSEKSRWNSKEMCIPRDQSFLFTMKHLNEAIDTGLCKVEILIDKEVVYSNFFDGTGAPPRFRFNTRPYPKHIYIFP